MALVSRLVRSALQGLRLLLGATALLQVLRLSQVLMHASADAFAVSAQLLPAVLFALLLLAFNLLLLWLVHRVLRRAGRVRS